jgi:hypothetical protein
MSFKWRLWCNTHGWVYKWADEEITQCPIISTDPVDVSKIFKVGTIVPTLNLSPLLHETKNKDYTRMASILYDNRVRGAFHIVKILSYMDDKVDSYDIEVYDDTNNISLSSLTGITNILEYSEHTLELTSDSSSTDKLLVGIYMRKSSNKGDNCYLSQISFYRRDE